MKRLSVVAVVLVLALIPAVAWAGSWRVAGHVGFSYGRGGGFHAGGNVHAGAGHGVKLHPGYYYHPWHGHRPPHVWHPPVSVHPHPSGTYHPYGGGRPYHYPYYWWPCGPYHYPLYGWGWAHPYGWGGVSIVVHGGHGVGGNGWVVRLNGAPNSAPMRLDGTTPPPFPAGVENPKKKREATAETPPTPTPAPMAGLGRIYRRGNVARTERAFRKAMRAAPNSADLYYANAWVFLTGEKYLPAALVLKRARALDKRQPPNGRSALKGFYDKRAAAVALARLNLHVQASPDDAEAQLVRAWVRVIVDGFDEAEAKRLLARRDE